MSKLVKDLKEAVRLSGLRDGMTVSFHHHLRNGDNVMNMVLHEISEMGIKDLTVNASSVFDVQSPLLDHMRSGVVTGLETAYISPGIGKKLSEGVLSRPLVFRTHGGRAGEIMNGSSKIDVAFIAASVSDNRGNCSGLYGKSAFGGMGYAYADARMADKVVVITDNLAEYPLVNASVFETYVDYVCVVDSIGNPEGIVSGTTRVTDDPVRLQIADMATECIEASGLLKDGFAFQTGAGGISLAVAGKLKEKMLAGHITGSYCTGGMNGFMVDMLESGCFKALYDVQCFDLNAVESLRRNENHVEISAEQYAGASAKYSMVDGLSTVVLGATEIDFDFNVNVHTDSFGRIMGGSGGHSDAAAGADMTMIVAPLFRKRFPLIRRRAACISTPGNTVDVLVTQYGIAVNPARNDLKERFLECGLPVTDIQKLYETAVHYTGEPEYPENRNEKVIAKVLYRNGKVIDSIYRSI